MHNIEEARSPLPAQAVEIFVLSTMFSVSRPKDYFTVHLRTARPRKEIEAKGIEAVNEFMKIQKTFLCSVTMK